uniref:Uncharacterized protein n=1 Tax=Candidatus Methanophaga sp. ANME-1 ERB7 TaxID=2759913 RepID=A0A7G9Z254_9EURY|nr:hypothetical protein DIMBOPOO_00010 [Methanosarcinales archaeon ANME-1 ERB7]
MSEYKLFAQRVGLVGITNAIVSLRVLIPILSYFFFSRVPKVTIFKWLHLYVVVNN